MLKYKSGAGIGVLSLLIGVSGALAQPPGGMPRMGGGMMGQQHDSATMADMRVSHELVMNHTRITRTVTNLPNGVRTVTESADPRLAQLIVEHVANMGKRSATGDNAGLPMASPALLTILKNRERIRTTTEPTGKGVIVVETSSDSVVVAALQKHAAEVTELVQEGMAAMHRGNPMAAMHNTMHDAMHGSDTAFAAMQQRGQRAMGVDQYTSTHHFEPAADGGRIEFQRDMNDSAGIAQIRTHLQEIAVAFAKGDFSIPGFVHAQEVPGTKVMAARRELITYTYRELPRGGEVSIVTRDAEALAAVHAFLEFQRRDHRAH